MDFWPTLRPSVALALTSLFVWLFYLLGLAVHRLYLDPIAKFPGPKLAALSQWYEFYYEVILEGQFTFHIQELHKKYGPIVRVNPHELHIEDSDFFDEFYSRVERRDKYESTAGRFGNNSSIFTTSDHNLHSRRRAPLNPMFSKRSIVNFQSVIRDKLSILIQKIAEYKESGDGQGEVLNMSKAWSAMAGDIICEYAFAMCYNHLESPGFDHSFHEAYLGTTKFGHVVVQFPWIHTVMNALPDWVNEKMTPAVHMLLVLKKDLIKRIGQIKNGETDNHKTVLHPTIFYEMINSNLPPEELSLERLGNEAQTIIGAGLETTAYALSIASFHIVNEPSVHSKLKAELTAALPTVETELDWLQLEKLPYLTGCVQEAIRLSYGISARQQRVSPGKTIRYREWIIPAGTPVSMTIVDVHHDEKIYPDSRKFVPQRWMNDPKTADSSPLSRYFVAFGKDARSCLGTNLAYAEMYLSLAAVFRQFTFELYETDASDVELAHDFFLPSPKMDSQGVRVKVKSVES